MNRKFAIVLRPLVIFTLIFGSGAEGASVSVNAWTPLYQGIDYTTGSVSGVDSSVAYGVRIDLTAPGISFLTTPPGGSQNTISETTSQFVEKTGVQVAINANFFAPCCNAFPEEKTLTGLAISDGTVVSQPTSARGSSNAALLISRTNVATIATTATNMNLANVYNAVAGSAIIVQNGVNIGSSSANQGDPANPNPRTDVGVSEDGRFLYLVTIDGRQTGYSVGTTIPETADLMIAFGAYNAINLDGGGSTVLVKSDGQGGTVDLNRPSGGTERYDGNALGVYALPLITPEPGTAGMFVLAGIGVLLLQKRERSGRTQP